MIKTAQRDFFLYALTLVTLYVSVWRFIALLFVYIDVLFPDPLSSFAFYGHPYDTVRHSMASLIVMFPVYLGLSWFLRKDIIRHPEKRDFVIRKLFIYLTLFLAAATIITDLIFLINRFLNGDLTLPFSLRVLTVMLVAGGVLAYYFWDLRREVIPTSKPSRLLTILVSAIVLASIVTGFVIFGMPATQRKRRLDEERLTHLQNIQYQIFEYYRQKSELPASLDDLKSDVTGFIPPRDPVTQAAYEYRVTTKLNFELCATFDLPSSAGLVKGKKLPPLPESQKWEYDSGRACFPRTIDEAFLQPLPGVYPPPPPVFRD